MTCFYVLIINLLYYSIFLGANSDWFLIPWFILFRLLKIFSSRSFIVIWHLPILCEFFKIQLAEMD